MIDIITVMQSLEIRDETYERFLSFKVKYNPNLSNEEFIQFLMTRYENCCLKFRCNGYINGVTEHCKLDSEVSASIMDLNNSDTNLETQSQTNETETRPIHDTKVITCPECKHTSQNRKEMEQHFNDCHDMSGAFPCTCDQCFCNLSEFLAHYITCPIAATDLQNSGMMEVQFEEEDDEDRSPNDDDKEFDEGHSPIVQSTEAADDSFDEPLDFHMHSPSYSNPLNLVKAEKTAYNNDSANSSSPEKPRLPDNNSSLLDASSPGNGYLSKRSGKVYECEHCEKIFKSKGLLDQHKHLHYPPRHECEYCGRRFRWPPQFYTHKQQCSKRRSKTIDSSEVGNFKRHNYGYTGVTSNNIGNQDPRLQQVGNMFTTSPQGFEHCLCGYKGNNSTEIYEHKRTCVTSARALILQKIIDYKSIQTPPNITNLNGSTLSNSSVHSVMNNFVSTNSDNHLGKVAKPVGSVSGQNSKSNELKPFECDFCESRFMTKISLKQHLDGKHSDQAKYCCEKCGKGYFWNASYNYHKKKCTFQPLSSMATAGLKQ